MTTNPYGILMSGLAIQLYSSLRPIQERSRDIAAQAEVVALAAIAELGLPLLTLTHARLETARHL